MLKGNAGMDYYDDLFFALATPVPDFHRRTHVPIYYGIQFNRSGRLRLRIGDGEMLDLEGAWVFITHPGCRFEYELAGARPHHYRVICFNGVAVGRYIEHGLLPMAPEPIRITHVDRFRQAMEETSEAIHAGPASHARAAWLFEGLLLQLHEQAPARRLQAWQLPLLDELGDAMRRHPEQEWNFVDAATRLHVRLTHFRRLFRQYFGSSPQQFLIRLRLEQAARMLISSRETLAAVAEAVGIGDEYYFSHLFKQRYGVSPGAYRREFHRSE